MKKEKAIRFLLSVFVVMGMSCSNATKENESSATAAENTAAPAGGGQATVSDETSAPNIVKVAINSKDHSTLVTAVQAADLVNALANNGPFTVFAPTNAAFDALPAGTVEGLLKPEKKDALSDILQYHVFIGVLTEPMMHDGQVIGMANDGKATLHVKDGKYMINDAHIVGSVTASNGLVYVIDKVISPQASN
jgi:uncharacterized surface protein with fasciclin (FAS1) repeats